MNCPGPAFFRAGPASGGPGSIGPEEGFRTLSLSPRYPALLERRREESRAKPRSGRQSRPLTPLDPSRQSWVRGETAPGMPRRERFVAPLGFQPAVLFTVNQYTPPNGIRGPARRELRIVRRYSARVHHVVLAAIHRPPETSDDELRLCRKVAARSTLFLARPISRIYPANLPILQRVFVKIHTKQRLFVSLF